MLRAACNEVNMGNNIIENALALLAERLPPGWRVEQEDPTPGPGDFRYDAVLRVAAPDRRRARIAAEAKSRVEPRDALLIATVAARLQKMPLLVISQYLSGATQERLREARVNWVDLTGNIRLVLRDPGLFVETTGASRRPKGGWSARSLKGRSAGRAVRTLLAAPLPIGVRDLAQRAGIDAGYVSRVLDLLDEAALVERGARGRVERVDRARLVRRWADDAPLASRGDSRMFLEPRGVTNLLDRLKNAPLRYAITGSLAAQRWAPVAPARLAQLYVDAAPADASTTLGLRPAESGGNVQLIRPRDATVFGEAQASQDGLMYASPVQVAADLLTSPGRGPAEGEELLRWMAEREEAWRG